MLIMNRERLIKTQKHAGSAASSPTVWPGLSSKAPPRKPTTHDTCSAVLVLFLKVCRYLICGLGGNGCGVWAELAPGQGKGVDSALHPLRSCSSSCLPD